MSPFLHVFLSYPFILSLLALTILVMVIKKRTKILTGLGLLLESPSGVFGLLTLLAITLVTWFQPSVGGTAFAAFVAVVPAILTWVEHKETMVQICQTPQAPPVVPNTSTNLPARGIM